MNPTEPTEPRCRAHGCLCEQPETCRFNVPTPTDAQWGALSADMARLAASLIPTIHDDYRASDDPDDDVPAIQVTVGVTVQPDGSLSWSYQTGDNSYSGGAYCHATWGIGYLYRDTDPTDFAESIESDVADNLPI